MRSLLIITFSLITFSAQSLTLKNDYPQHYKVKSGDTLWGIANQYLKNPWEWHELWHANPHLKNPGKLAVGTVLTLQQPHQHPYLQVSANTIVKLSPNIRIKPENTFIPPISLMDIKPFLNASLVMDQNTLKNAAYVAALTSEHLLGGQGDEVYVKNLPMQHTALGTDSSYAIYRPGHPYFEPKTHRLLGFKTTLIGHGDLVQNGNPAKLLLTDITEGVRVNDRVVLNNYPDFQLYFEPKAPLYPIEGAIIDLPGDYTQGAAGLVAIVDRGEDAGLEAGDVLGIYSPKRLVPDPQHRGKTIILPRERVGELMIFRTFSQTSFALVVRSVRAIHIMDIVTNP